MREVDCIGKKKGMQKDTPQPGEIEEMEQVPDKESIKRGCAASVPK